MLATDVIACDNTNVEIENSLWSLDDRSTAYG